MKKVLSILLTTFVFFSGAVKAEWTGDVANDFYSNAVITDMHVGQIDQSPYFCIKAQINNNETISACSIQKQSIWGHSYETLFSQARFFYSTGQKIRLYVKSNVWTYDKFYSVFTRNALVGLSTCANNNTCFGPSYYE